MSEPLSNVARFYQDRLAEAQKAFRNVDYDTCYNICDELLLEPDLSPLIKAGAHKLLGTSKDNGFWHADKSLALYKELENLDPNYADIRELRKTAEIVYLEAKQNEGNGSVTADDDDGEEHFVTETAENSQFSDVVDPFSQPDSSRSGEDSQATSLATQSKAQSSKPLSDFGTPGWRTPPSSKGGQVSNLRSGDGGQKNQPTISMEAESPTTLAHRKEQSPEDTM